MSVYGLILGVVMIAQSRYRLRPLRLSSPRVFVPKWFRFLFLTQIILVMRLVNP